MCHLRCTLSCLRHTEKSQIWWTLSRLRHTEMSQFGGHYPVSGIQKWAIFGGQFSVPDIRKSATFVVQCPVSNTQNWVHCSGQGGCNTRSRLQHTDLWVLKTVTFIQYLSFDQIKCAIFRSTSNLVGNPLHAAHADTNVAFLCFHFRLPVLFNSIFPRTLRT